MAVIVLADWVKLNKPNHALNERSRNVTNNKLPPHSRFRIDTQYVTVTSNIFECEIPDGEK